MRTVRYLAACWVEPDTVATGMNHLRTLCLPRRLFQPRAVVLVILPKYLAVKFFNPVHFDGRLIRSKRPRDSRSGVRRDCPARPGCIGECSLGTGVPNRFLNQASQCRIPWLSPR